MARNPLERDYIFCPRCKERLARRLIDRRRLLACPSGHFVFWSNPKPAASVVIADQDRRVLLLKRANAPLRGFWCLPGGFIDYMEAPGEAAIREVREETALEIRIERLIGVYRIDNDPRGAGIDIIYAGRIAGGRLTVNTEEASEAVFCPPGSLPRRIAYKHAEAVRDWARQ